MVPGGEMESKFSESDLLTYLEIALYTLSEVASPSLDLSEEEITRLRLQLNDYMGGRYQDGTKGECEGCGKQIGADGLWLGECKECADG